MIECPFCHSTELRWVDSLGELTHGQCRHCGVVFALGDVLPEELSPLEVDPVELVTYGY